MNCKRLKKKKRIKFGFDCCESLAFGILVWVVGDWSAERSKRLDCQVLAELCMSAMAFIRFIQCSLKTGATKSEFKQYGEMDPQWWRRNLRYLGTVLVGFPENVLLNAKLSGMATMNKTTKIYQLLSI